MFENDEEIQLLIGGHALPSLDQIVDLAKKRQITDPRAFWAFHDNIRKAYKEKRSYHNN